MPSTPMPSNSLPRAFGRLAAANLAAQSAEQIALAAIPIVAVLGLGAQEGEAGLLQTALTLPFLVAAIPAGLLADRLPRRGLMAGAELLRAAALATILVLALLGQASWPLLAGLGFLSACGTVVFSVAGPALVPALVPPAALGTANARIELARTAAFAGGPALGGALVGWTGAAPAFAVAVALSLAAALALVGIAEPRRPAPPRRHPWREIREGAAFAVRHPLLRPVLATQVVFNTAFFLLLAAFVPYAARHLRLDAAGIGVVLGLYGLGMMAGALLSPAILRHLRFGRVVGIGPLAGLAASAVVALTIVVPSPALAGAGLFLLGAGPILWVISTTTLRQAVTPAAMLGRVSGLSVMSQGARPLGAALAALVGGLSGAEACLVLAVVVFALQALLIWTSPAVRLAHLPAGPPHHSDESSPSSLKPSSTSRQPCRM
ncbi:MFS transporter [Methylobacterium platani]|uniref:MFS transporter n=2 Tax=Methylobacterium platani TaxID=427683 RepID=A0A179SGU0_9HYPH|nr:MFS transporter [Methylobacterium platani]KMO11275.1 MFS transporter [Methylobacterium platani JCM 14648]OAS26825.1 MFS transporter [Methylobacterium platani]